MKEIVLTQNKVALVDDNDYEWLNQWKWYAYKNKATYYAKRSAGGRLNRKNIKMHRLILRLTDSKIDCDHIDHNGLNNQRSNLRIATRSQNASNVFSKNGSSSKYLGVYWSKQHQKWRSKITKNGVSIHIGTFNNEIEAALAYNNIAKQVHGDFANINIT